MRNIAFGILLLLLLAGCGKDDEVTGPDNQIDTISGDLTLVWSDDFDGSGLPDPAKWNYDVGGNWGGQQGVDNSIFPQQMVIDYVRVYQWVE